MSTKEDNLRLLSGVLHAAGALALGCASLLAYRVAFLPLVRQQQQSQIEMAELDQLWQRAPHIRREHAGLAARMSDFEQRMAEMRRRVPDEPQEAEFLRELAEMAQRKQVDIQTYQRGETTQLPDHARLSIQLSLLARYEDLCYFLEELTRLSRIATVEKMEIATAPDQDQLPVELTLQLYYTPRSEQPLKAVAAR